MSVSANSLISYSVIRSERATADIVVERDGTVVVRAPESVDDESVREIVRSKLYWIYKTLAEWKELNQSRVVREYRNGESFLYLGRSYRLALVDDQDEDVLLKGGRFCLRRQLLAADDLSSVRAAFRSYYSERGSHRINDRVRYFAPKVGITPGTVSIRELGHRWGACSSAGDLSFHWKCMMAPATIVDYIVVHELAHARERDHTDAFWNEVDKVLPDYRDRRGWLRQHGASLDV
jgi:hypothetical protein